MTGPLNYGRERGVTLIEVMVAVFITAIGLLGAAALQLNALKYTDSARTTSQATFIAYDILDRIRANADLSTLDDYGMSSLSDAPSSAATILEQDKKDFADNVGALNGGTGSIVVDGTTITVTIGWSESRANKAAGGESSGDTGQIQITSEAAVPVGASNEQG
ncbi:type IV pilus modification protein PilV [Pseudomonas sp. sia0905]|uniref:type IV pilus modification protein PilV n=1 Tax=Pseudomonas sp. sia0905 TaxID=2854783 RepID=UPI001C471190|nr:type IV pilus modification protein PilV [Pseudomonas sp. sia0905]MBV7561369.1 type IV pilus modification protein PilV [Pseudomonas sp. sia0905]